jgi:putative SOS response-associated peptidase YedK
VPVILDPADYSRWLDCSQQDVLDLLKPFPPDRMQLIAVSTLVNSPRNERPECAQLLK